MIHIEDLFTAMAQFQARSTRIRSESLRNPLKWEADMEKARAEFKDAIGPLAEHIDWSAR